MTVTRVFIRSDQVTPETRARVQNAVTELGYVPDRASGVLATRRSGFVGLLLPTPPNGNFAALAEGLTEQLRPAGYELLIGYTGYSMGEEEHLGGSRRSASAMSRSAGRSCRRSARSSLTPTTLAGRRAGWSPTCSTPACA